MSYPEIAQQQEISYQNVRKRISQARAILREELRGYFIGEDGTNKELSITPSLAATESATGRNAEVELIVLSVAVEEVEIVAGAASIEVVRSTPYFESFALGSNAAVDSQSAISYISSLTLDAEFAQVIRTH